MRSRHAMHGCVQSTLHPATRGTYRIEREVGVELTLRQVLEEKIADIEVEERGRRRPVHAAATTNKKWNQQVFNTIPACPTKKCLAAIDVGLSSV